MVSSSISPGFIEPPKQRQACETHNAVSNASDGDVEQVHSEVTTGGLFQYFAAVDTLAGFRIVEIVSSGKMGVNDEPKGRTQYVFSDDETGTVHTCDGNEIKIVDTLHVDDDPVYVNFDTRTQNQHGFVVVQAIST